MTELDAAVLDAVDVIAEPLATMPATPGRDSAVVHLARAAAARLGRPDMADAIRREALARLNERPTP